MVKSDYDEMLMCFLCRRVSANDLAIPDTYCSPHNNSGYECPRGMECVPLELSRSDRGFNGFGEFGNIMRH